MNTNPDWQARASRLLHSGHLFYAAGALGFICTVTIGLVGVGQARLVPARKAMARTTLRFPQQTFTGANQERVQKKGQTRGTGGDSESQGGGSPSADLLQAYAAGLLQRIDRAKEYPEDEAGRSALVWVRIRVNRKGQLQSVHMIAPSAYASFNQAALSAVRRAAPFPPIPASAKKDAIILRVQIRFIAGS